MPDAALIRSPRIRGKESSMSKNLPSIRIGIFGSTGADPNERHGCGLWAAGYAPCIAAEGAEPVYLGETVNGRSWDQLLDGLDGVVFAAEENVSPRQSAQGERLALWCRKRKFPILAIDGGMHVLNAAFGGTLYQDLARELPEALQHRHPPEKGLRHAINVLPGSLLCDMYGEGEVVVNSEHRKAVQRIGRGFRVGAQALDGVIEAIEAELVGWFAMGVQWQPASSTASGLDIQLFRGLIDFCKQGVRVPEKTLCASAA
jgi:putative glutamine amidotransferase